MQAEQLPAYSDEHLAGLSVPELWRLLLRDEDRVPRNVIDECARRDDILDSIEDLLRKDYYWTDDVGAGEAWLPLHAAMILGLVGSQRAGELLLGLLEHGTSAEEVNSLHWLDGAWPALFRNKPESVIVQLRKVAQEREAHEGDQYDDPWTFYSAEEIAERQIRWAEEDRAGLNRYGEEAGETYMREGPKVGRNDPCPCGSGKKYKRCCMPQ